MDDHEAMQLCGSLESLLGTLVGQPSKAEITAALRSLLEHGDVVGMHCSWAALTIVPHLKMLA